MNHISKRLEQAVDAASLLRPDQQDFLAAELMERVQTLAESPVELSARERTELEAERDAALRGELATDEEVAAVFKKHGL